MPPPQWCSRAQREWLEARMPDFVAARAQHNLPQFWSVVEAAWIQDWEDFDAQWEKKAVRRLGLIDGDEDTELVSQSSREDRWEFVEAGDQKIQWTNDEQTPWLEARLPKYLNAKTTGDQSDFFVALDEGWFKKWPEEATNGLPAAESGVPLTAEETATLSAALKKRKKQLRSWFRNHVKTQRDSGAVPVKRNDTESLAAAIWKDQTRHRGPQVVEVYQKLYPDRVRKALKAEGFYRKHGEDIEWVAEDGETPGVELKKTLREQSAVRMTVMRRVTRALVDEEEPDVLERLEQEIVRLKELSSTEASSELTPERAQRSLDQLEGIVSNFHKILNEKTGWVGFTMVGGPTPNAGGALSLQVFSSGLTPAGHTFRQAHSNWKTAVSSPFTEFLKKCFPRSVRDAMALPDPVEDLDDLLKMSDDDAEEEAPTSPQANTWMPPVRIVWGVGYDPPKRTPFFSVHTHGAGCIHRFCAWVHPALPFKLCEHVCKSKVVQACADFLWLCCENAKLVVTHTKCMHTTFLNAQPLNTFALPSMLAARAAGHFDSLHMSTLLSEPKVLKATGAFVQSSGQFDGAAVG
ncbi:hypothetical protein B0H16DRAFT_1452136 [Mycena metata]|uniref:Uncharacterized protein n=1 Tax=Mycena metata TaxID=1033252 RepID=A0AAD7JW82_9AGAR|nr:hypothetical protein B0H16DRAFT_1452136 [Mycena metata]